MTFVNDKNSGEPQVEAGAGSPIGRLSESDSAPLYEIVKRQVSEAILIGQWVPGTVLPSEVALAQSFGVAVGTVRRALTDLTAEGLLARRRKTGTVVTGRTPHHSLRLFFQFFRLHGLDGALVKSRARVLSLETAAARSDEAEKLQLAEGAQVVRIRRTRHVDSHPVMVDRFTLPAARVPGFPAAAGDVPELLYLFLLERYGIRISAVREQLAAELASPEDAEVLGLTPPAAVLIIDEVAYDQSGAPTLFARHCAITDRHRYVNEVR
ncbi:MAG: GntR family transcriptional regulator [Thalassobaculum sp.]|uniref:GntR family transcriptional regulator n=1 Tax=Thalassobaculum sp. TaxID=2022740 RepID=UPI0032EFCF65